MKIEYNKMNFIILKRRVGQLPSGNSFWRECPYGYSIAMRIGRFPFQFPLGVQLGIGTQPHYKAPVDHQVKILENASVNIKLVKLSPQEQSKVGHRTTK